MVLVGVLSAMALHAEAAREVHVVSTIPVNVAVAVRGWAPAPEDVEGFLARARQGDGGAARAVDARRHRLHRWHRHPPEVPSRHWSPSRDQLSTEPRKSLAAETGDHAGRASLRMVASGKRAG
jgi:hypothetical protein